MANIQRVIAGQSPTLMQAAKANELIDLMNGLMQSKGSDGINVIVEGSGRLVIGLDDTAGGGLPEGYEETAVTLCQNGSPVAGSILFKAD